MHPWAPGDTKGTCCEARVLGVVWARSSLCRPCLPTPAHLGCGHGLQACLPPGQQLDKGLSLTPTLPGRTPGLASTGLQEMAAGSCHPEGEARMWEVTGLD